MSSYTGVDLSADDGDFFFCRQWPHNYLNVAIENNTEAAMATLIDDAIAIFPSWLKELPIIIIDRVKDTSY